MNFASNLCLIVALLLTVIATRQDASADAMSYGTDCTFPVQHEIDTMQKECKHFRLRYNDFIAGCSKMYGEENCVKMEKSRMDKNVEMPPLQHNYTDTGYRVDKVDNGLWRQINKFYEAHQNDSTEEAWPPGFYLTNIWDTPTKQLNIYDPQYEEGSKLREAIEKGLQPIVEEWIGHRVIATGIAGIRIYQEKAILATHVDRIPSVITAHIAVEATSDWPFEVYDHSGYAHNITAKTGEVILYESSTILHGRPFPLEGPRYACLTVHYIPIDHDNLSERDLQTLPDVEPLMIRRRHGHTFRKTTKGEKDSNGPTMMDAIQVQAAASRGEIVELNNILEKFPKLIYFTDENGWQPIFEAVRGGNIEAVQYLVRRGANLDWKNYNNESVMDIALQHLSADHVVTNYLKLFFPDTKK